MSEYRDRVIFIATQTQDYWRVGLPETTTWKEFYRRYDLVYIIMINVYTTGFSCLPNYVKTTDGMIDLCLWQSVESASLPPPSSDSVSVSALLTQTTVRQCNYYSRTDKQLRQSQTIKCTFSHYQSSLAYLINSLDLYVKPNTIQRFFHRKINGCLRKRSLT